MMDEDFEVFALNTRHLRDNFPLYIFRRLLYGTHAMTSMERKNITTRHQFIVNKPAEFHCADMILVGRQLLWKQ